MVKDGWVYCPMCSRKTRTKIYPQTVATQFPLYCRFCKAEMLVDFRDGDVQPSFKLKRKPDAKSQMLDTEPNE